MPKVTIIVNRRAGTVLRLGEEQVRRVLARGLAAERRDTEIRLVDPGELLHALEAAFASDCEVVGLGGGDGTLRSAAPLAMHSGKSLAILPLGTLNLLSKDLGVPQALEAAARLIPHGRVRQIDVGEVNEEYFLVKAMIGRINATVRAREKTRSRFNPLTWAKVLWHAARAVFRVRKRRFRIAFDGTEELHHTAMLTVAVNRLTGRLGNPFFRARLDGGKLAVYRFPEMSSETLLAHLDSESPVLDSFLLGEAKGLTVSTRRPRLYASLDGELVFLKTPLRFTLHAHALSVIGSPS